MHSCHPLSVGMRFEDSPASQMFKVLCRFLALPEVGLRVGFALVPGLALLLCSLTAAAESPVTTEKLSAVASFPERSATATVVSLNPAVLSAQVSGQIIAIESVPGNLVQAGERLAEIDCRDYEYARANTQARLAGVMARMDLAEKRLKRAKELLAKKTLADEVVDERTSELLSLRADQLALDFEIRTAAVQIERCVLVAPFPALVTARESAVGNYVRPGDAVLSVLDTSAIELSAMIPVRLAGMLENAGEWQFESGGQRYQVKLARVVAALDPATRNQEARFHFIAQAALPGAAGQIIWRDNRPHLPADLLVERNGHYGIFYAEQGRAQFHRVPDAQAGRPVPVALPLNTEIIINGHLSLRDADSIKISVSQ